MFDTPAVYNTLSWFLVLTHPDFSEAALSQFDLQPQRLSGDLPGVFGQTLGLGLDRGTDGRQSVTQPVGVFCDRGTHGDEAAGLQTPRTQVRSMTALNKT